MDTLKTIAREVKVLVMIITAMILVPILFPFAVAGFLFEAFKRAWGAGVDAVDSFRKSISDFMEATDL